MHKITFLFTSLFTFFINSNYLQAQVTPVSTTMEFGSSTLVLAAATNPSVDQSAHTLLNGFDVSMTSSGIRYIAFALSGNGSGTTQTASGSEAALYFGGDANGTSNSCTLSTDSGNEIGITSFDFAYENNLGPITLTFTAEGKKDGIIIGTKTISAPHNTLINVDLTSSITGAFTDIDQLVLTPSSPITGGWTMDSIIVTEKHTLEVSKQEFNDKITTYPNPSSDFIYFKGLSKNENYTVYNSIGTKIFSGNTNKEIDIQNLTNGIYLLKLDNGNTSKFIKQ
ncbi:T9SS type A sorting domain-containing protein [Algibacter sp. Ld11]|uniref:T9SS type A sorting domain-containing protein n=1 Tax=Algibacter sp. Ld11 TaxID=649150 RepID=UPI00386C90EB